MTSPIYIMVHLLYYRVVGQIYTRGSRPSHVKKLGREVHAIK